MHTYRCNSCRMFYRNINTYINFNFWAIRRMEILTSRKLSIWLKMMKNIYS